MKKSSLFIILIATLVVPSMLMADLLMYEGFEYTAGETLGGKSGGTGWTSSWNTNPHIIAAESLDMSNLLFSPKGGSVYSVGSNTANRNFPAIDLAADGTYYVSFLCKKTGWTEATSGEWGDIHFRSSGWARVATWSNTSNEEFATDNIGGTVKVSGADTSEVIFMIGKLVTREVGNDEIYLKVYEEADSISTVEPLAWTVSGGVEDNSEVASMFTIWPGSSEAFTFYVDEIRVGTQWADVVAPAVDGRVVYLEPSEGSENISPVDFDWHAPADIESPTYKLYYSSTLGEVDPNDATPDVSPVTLTESSYGSVTLDSPVTYYWRVDVVDGADVIVGDIASFDTIVPIYPVDPVDEAISVARNVTLTWDSLLPITGNYDVYMGDSEATLSYVGESTAESYTPSGLQWGQTYYWQVVYDDGVDVIQSVAWSFTVADGPVCDGTLLGDFNEDCLTDLSDFAVIAAEWMNCTATNADDCQ
ncbi:MAG: hypothetical protein ACIAQZ_08345 [Sedimentisphaeraceae bacterium JB056]